MLKHMLHALHLTVSFLFRKFCKQKNWVINCTAKLSDTNLIINMLEFSHFHKSKAHCSPGQSAIHLDIPPSPSIPLHERCTSTGVHIGQML